LSVWVTQNCLRVEKTSYEYLNQFTLESRMSLILLMIDSINIGPDNYKCILCHLAHGMMALFLHLQKNPT